MDINKNKCTECQKVFSNRSNLRKHSLKFHKDKVEEIAPMFYKQSSNFKFSCQECGRNFNHVHNLRKHVKTHSLVQATVKDGECEKQARKCPLCENFTSVKKDLLKHFNEEHQIEIQSKQISFSSEKDFYEWKDKIEADTNANFIKTDSVSSKKRKIKYFACNRSGNYVSRITKDKRKRRLKTQGSHKINAYCPASIKLIKNQTDNLCQIEFIDKHVGHQMDLKHLHLKKIERHNLAQKISNKIPFDEILNNIHDSAPDSELQRIHLLTRKDLHNIEQSLNQSSSAAKRQGLCIYFACYLYNKLIYHFRSRKRNE